MDTRIIKEPNTKTKLNRNLDNDLSLNTCLHSNCLSHDDHLEILTVKSVSYTTLKGLLPAASPTAGATAITSPTDNSSWHEIPIKNPLVKQAALAYLQPMSSPPELGDHRGLFGKFMDVCCSCFCQCECFGWINGVVFRIVRDYEDDDDDEKVD